MEIKGHLKSPELKQRKHVKRLKTRYLKITIMSTFHTRYIELLYYEECFYGFMEFRGHLRPQEVKIKRNSKRGIKIGMIDTFH